MIIDYIEVLYFFYRHSVANDLISTGNLFLNFCFFRLRIKIKDYIDIILPGRRL